MIVHGHYPDMYPFEGVSDMESHAPHKGHHRPPRREPFRGFDFSHPENGTGLSRLPEVIREVKHAFGNCLSVPAVFSPEVEDGDLVVPVSCITEKAAEELNLAICGAPDAVWVPAFRCKIPHAHCHHHHHHKPPIQPRSTDAGQELKPIVGYDNTHRPPFFGVAYTRDHRVMLGPVVAHPRYRFTTGTKIFATLDGHVTSEDTGVQAGVCLAPGFLYLTPYASEILRIVQEVKDSVGEVTDSIDEKMQEVVDKITTEGIDISNCTVTVPGTTTQRPLKDRFADWVNVKDFGAAGDGIHDDSTAFEAATRYSQTLGENHCLFIPVGEYPLTTVPTAPCVGPGTILHNGKAYKPFELMFSQEGAISPDEAGRFGVNISDIYAPTGGLAQDSSGKLVVTGLGNLDQAALEGLLKSIIKEMLPEIGGGIIEDENGNIIIDLNNMTLEEFRKFILSLLPESGGAIKPGEDGKLTIDFSNMSDEELQNLIYMIIQQGGGLDVGSDGKIFVDFSLMPTDKFEKMLKDLHIPIWLTENRNFYVNPDTGEDKVAAGWGEAPNKPFRTIAFATNHVASNFNVDKYTAFIYLADGTYELDAPVYLSNFASTTGEIVILPENTPTERTGSGVHIICNDNFCFYALYASGMWNLRDLVLECRITKAAQVPTFIGCVMAMAANLTIRGCTIKATDALNEPNTNVSVRMAYAELGGNLYIRSRAGRNTVISCELTSTNFRDTAAMFSYRNAYISVTGSNVAEEDAIIYVDGAYKWVVATAESFWGAIVAYVYNMTLRTTPEKSISGKRYLASSGGRIVTGGKGPEFIPGSEPGTIETTTYSWYL